MINAAMLFLAGTMAIVWTLLSVAEIKRYEYLPEYEPQGRYKLWLLFCIIWTPIALVLGSVIFQALIMIPMTAHYCMVFYLADIKE